MSERSVHERSALDHAAPTPAELRATAKAATALAIAITVVVVARLALILALVATRGLPAAALAAPTFDLLAGGLLTFLLVTGARWMRRASRPTEGDASFPRALEVMRAFLLVQAIVAPSFLLLSCLIGGAGR